MQEVKLKIQVIKMKNRFNLLIISLVIVVLNGCSWKTYISQNSYGRMQLKEMKFKESFKNINNELIDDNSIYYHHSDDPKIDMEFNFIIRFFKNGQYAFFARNENPIINLSYNDIDFNDLKKANYVGYYKIKDKIVIIEYPNHLFRRAGKRNLDKYKILNNGDLESITNGASDYKSIYKKISVENLKQVIPDW